VVTVCLLGQLLRMAVDYVDLVPEVVPEDPIEYFEALFATSTLADEPLEVVAHCDHRLAHGAGDVLLKRLVVEPSPCDLFGLLGDRLDIRLYLR